MPYQHFSPHAARQQPCWHCRHFDGMNPPGVNARCSRPGGNRVRSQPEGGCSFWEREPGADDEPAWDPVVVLAPLTPRE
jgi:hypothetical protein